MCVKSQTNRFIPENIAIDSTNRFCTVFLYGYKVFAIPKSSRLKGIRSVRVSLTTFVERAGEHIGFESIIKSCYFCSFIFVRSVLYSFVNNNSESKFVSFSLSNNNAQTFASLILCVCIHFVFLCNHECV